MPDPLLNNQVSQVGWIGRQRTRHATTWELTPPPQPKFGTADPARIGLERRARARQQQERQTRNPFASLTLDRLQTLLNALRNP